MISKWQIYSIEGWGSYVLKERFNRLKTVLKQWNTEVFGRLDVQINNRKKEICKFDTIDEVISLEKSEIMKRNEESALLFCDLKFKDNILH